VDFNSLKCGCEGGLTGQLCPAAGPPPAPANVACFSGLGVMNPTGGRKTTQVAFRVEVADRGEPGTNDSYRIRIWIPTGSEDQKQLAVGACCSNPNPVGQAARTPDIDDGGNLLHGDIQIQPQIGNCPVASGSCAP